MGCKQQAKIQAKKINERRRHHFFFGAPSERKLRLLHKHCASSKPISKQKRSTSVTDINFLSARLWRENSGRFASTLQALGSKRRSKQKGSTRVTHTHTHHF